MTTKAKRKIQGRDWHGWAWKAGKTGPEPGVLLHWAEPIRPLLRDCRPTGDGTWVRVKFVEVD